MIRLKRRSLMALLLWAALGMVQGLTAQERYTLAKHSAAVRALAYSPDGIRLASGSHDGTITVWQDVSPYSP
ncbi:MAG: WD40 domain-containing protein [Treponema sp.]|jgi:WD40 repeat protein|nr:WD40 domain-containing protein [Treponema sp.]